MEMQKTNIRNSGLLFLAACIWGVAFVSQQVGMDYMGPLTFNGVRSLLGAVTLLPLIACKGAAGRRKDRKEIREETKIQKTDRKHGEKWIMYAAAGICCGLALAGGSSLQQMGLQYTSVGKAGFITTLYIIFVPVTGIFIGKRVQLQVWIGAAAAVVGLYMICVKESFSINKGDGLIFLCAVLFTIHILVIDYFSPKIDGVILSFLQFLVCGILCTIAAFVWETPQLSQVKEGIVPLLYAGVMSCGVGYTLQVIGQKNVNPTVAALILSMESVVSAVAGFVILGQELEPRELLGCLIVFAAVIFVQLPWKPQSTGNDLERHGY